MHEWRRSYDVPPPNGEGLEMCAERAVAYFRDQVCGSLEFCNLAISLSSFSPFMLFFMVYDYNS